MVDEAVAERRSLIDVIGSSIDSMAWEDALDRVSNMALRQQGAYICICNAHSVVTARQDVRFSSVLSAADMVTPDGAPVAWLMRRFGAPNQQRINGPDLMWKYFSLAATRGESIFLLGSTSETLAVLRANILREFPGLRIAGTYSPPFRPATLEEDNRLVANINSSGANTVWVAFGCPKQEIWMYEHKDRIRSVMIGVGAAFDYHAGTIRRAPLWMQDSGLEWLYRLVKEPKRLWRRYFVTNSLFILYALRQLA